MTNGDRQTKRLSEESANLDISDNQAERDLIRELFVPFRNLFIGLNIAIFFGAGCLIIREEALNRPMAERLVDGEVVAVLIGATAVQLGAIIIASMRDLMKRGSSGA